MKQLFRDDRGVITVEFALCLAVFVAVFLMSVEVFRVQMASMLLERCVSDIADQSRLNYGQGFQSTVNSVLKSRNYMFFDPDNVKVTAKHSNDFRVLEKGGGSSGAVGAAQVVRLKLEANLTIFKDFLPEPWQIQRTINYYYQNEDSTEASRY